MPLFDKLEKKGASLKGVKWSGSPPPNTGPSPLDQIRLLPDDTQAIRILPQELGQDLLVITRSIADESSLQQGALLSAEVNRQKAEFLDGRFRELSHELFNVTPENWWEPGPLLRFANRYEIPIMMARVNVANHKFDRSANHWVLILNTPVHSLAGDASRAAIYDPMRGEVGEIDLPPWELVVNDAGVICGATNQIYYNSLAARLLSEARYDLTLAGDTALEPEIVAAKVARFQTDGFRCGSMCLASALYRAGAKGLMSPYGQEQLEKDTGIHVVRREEIVKEPSPEIPINFL